jgi:hypothetical protein
MNQLAQATQSPPMSFLLSHLKNNIHQGCSLILSEYEKIRVHEQRILKITMIASAVLLSIVAPMVTFTGIFIGTVASFIFSKEIDKISVRAKQVWDKKTEEAKVAIGAIGLVCVIIMPLAIPFGIGAYWGKQLALDKKK